jgi:perosamine synthetase
MAQAKPVLADMDAPNNGFNISARSIESFVSKNTKAIIDPHILGVTAKINEILEFGIPVIEDCAQALGASYKGSPVGSFGDISTFSFYATKMISTGQGGMLSARCPSLIERIQGLTKYDGKEKHSPAHNLDLSDIQSALGLSQISRLPSFIERRRLPVINPYLTHNISVVSDHTW